MDSVVFSTMTDADHAPAVLAMMRALYAEDECSVAADPSRFPLTIRHLLEEPTQGRIILFKNAGTVCGYAVLIPYWSNEYGGTVLLVDELFVRPETRGMGIGNQFFSFLTRERPFNPVAVFLEVSPTNQRARRLYESLGFRARSNATLVCPLHHPAQLAP